MGYHRLCRNEVINQRARQNFDLVVTLDEKSVVSVMIHEREENVCTKFNGQLLKDCRDC